VLVDESGAGGVPAKPPPAKGFWASPRNKALAGAGLLALLLVPAVVVPAVVVPQQKAKQASSNSITETPSSSAEPSSQTEPVAAGTEPETEDRAAGITVPTRTTQRGNISRTANKTIKGLPKVAPEPFVPFVRINDGQVMKLTTPIHRLYTVLVVCKASLHCRDLLLTGPIRIILESIPKFF
jgi:hypothetical protein